MLLTIKSSHGTAKVAVASYDEASRIVRETIDRLDLTAGCGADQSNVFHSAVVTDGRKRSTISYNGRVWAEDGKEIANG